MKGNFKYVIRFSSILFISFFFIHNFRRKAIEQMFSKELDTMYKSVYGYWKLLASA